ncbi:transglutaminase-like cysteine peptidase [Pseudemcibacter sp.]|uniref:transglutaminase-like cysteine peptidase n=1 Tax=Pseudemcibacter sp. TaxID=2943293 RepID=UPI003F69BFC3|nr:transglutaminase-like cysteine peptidase [Emcibacteraceae bacterium]
MHLNNISYVTDITNWRQKDYWATISQFLNRDGDCEDYAIAKYYSLKELGFTSDQMRIVVVEDTNLNIAHAVLAVYYDNKIWVLDNQISQIIEHKKIVHYTPLYSINEKAWWLHKKIS